MKCRTLSLVLIGVLLGVFGCASDRSPEADGWTEVLEADLTPVQSEQLAQALEARGVLFSRLSTELRSSLEKGGPVEAIDVCGSAAPAIAQAVSEEQGLRIGRTSFKLRNPGNAPPKWAEPWVEKKVDENTYVAGPGGELGVLLPIRVQSPCLSCHGSDDQIPAEVQMALSRSYPEDNAKGFVVEDLRGWFWVEVGS